MQLRVVGQLKVIPELETTRLVEHLIIFSCLLILQTSIITNYNYFPKENTIKNRTVFTLSFEIHIYSTNPQGLCLEDNTECFIDILRLKLRLVQWHEEEEEFLNLEVEEHVL